MRNGEQDFSVRFISSKMGSRVVQYLATLSGAFLPFTSGINLGWSSPYLPFLQDYERSPVFFTNIEASWCAVMPLVGAPVGALLAALTVDRIGRKKLLLSIAPIIAICFLIIAYYPTVLTICLSRFIIGSTEGAVYTALPIYLGEISDPKIRGILGSSVAVAALTGVLFINVIGSYLSMFTSSLICSCISGIHFITFLWMPESPYYLIKTGDHEAAKRSLVKFRGSDIVSEEFSEITAAVKRQEACEKSNVLDLVLVGSNRKALLIYMILSFTNKFSGMNPVVFYTATIFEDAGGTLDPVSSVIIFNVAGVVATLLALLVIDRFGRRPLMMFSSLGCACALSGEALYFTLQTYSPSVLPYIGWLPITSLIIYNIIFNFGLSFGPVLFLSELFPTSVKANALGVADTISIIFGTLASKFFHALSDALGMYVPFWCFSVCSLIGSYLIYGLVPETKGKTLEDIQLELIGLKKEDGAKEKV